MTALGEIADTIENLPAVLAALLGPVRAEVLTTPPAQGEWSVHQIIGHLITGDGPAFRDRIASIVGGAEQIAPFDPGPPVAERDFDSEALDDLLAELAGERGQSAAYVRTLTGRDLVAASDFGRHGWLAAGDFVHEWPFHDHDHVQQILTILKSVQFSAMTPSMQRALSTD